MFASALLLGGLVMADRTVAWLIGQFPTSAALWELRFEYLRPIAVFHDLVALRLGDIPLLTFNFSVVGLVALVALGGVSRLRLARAVASHFLLAALVVVAVYSAEPAPGTFPKVGEPSTAYLFLGGILAFCVGVACAGIHAEYIGWHVGSFSVTRRMKRASYRLQAQFADVLAALWPQYAPALVMRSRRR